MMPPRVTIVSGLQVIDNPRVVKEADAFAEMGWDVEVLGAIFDEASKAKIVALHTGRRWRHTAVVDLTNAHILPKSAIFLRRGGARASRILKRRLGYDHPLQLSFLTGALAKHALARHANLFSLHTEAALWAGRLLVKHNRPIRIDIEDWYSEDGLPADRASRPIALMKDCERLLLNRAVHATATSSSMAHALADEYGCPEPEVVHNSFPSDERARLDGRTLDRRSLSRPSIIWFSQTIGPGRGTSIRWWTPSLCSMGQPNCISAAHLEPVTWRRCWLRSRAR